jgi:hypothetical protein
MRSMQGKHIEIPHDHEMPCQDPSANQCKSKSQYETRLKKWAFGKYSTRDNWLAISSAVNTRRLQGKRSMVLFDGKEIPKSRFQKETRRHQGRENNTASHEGAFFIVSTSFAW